MSFFDKIAQYAAESDADDARILTIEEAAQEILNHATVTDDPLESDQYATIPLKWLRKLEAAQRTNVWIVLQRKFDQHLYTRAVFSSKKMANAYIAHQDNKEEYSVEQWHLDGEDGS
jgi:hypothetical protein